MLKSTLQRLGRLNTIWSITNILLALYSLIYIATFEIHRNISGMSKVTSEQMDDFGKVVPISIIQVFLVLSGMMYLFYTISSHYKNSQKMRKSLWGGLIATISLPLVIILGIGFNESPQGSPLFWILLIMLCMQNCFSLYLRVQLHLLSRQHD